MSSSLPYSLNNVDSDSDKKNMVLALSRVEAGLEQITDRHTRMLKRMKEHEKVVDDMLEQLSQRQAATLRYISDLENSFNRKFEELAQKHEEIMKK
ncbi:MAG: hypothetical protein HQL69_21420 [Magnetococcales bacterium]|nr:hypothetical protein [Magnetococcales bacterium]